MALVRFQATKMSDAKVSHISLVERGANRIPFKVVKQEVKGMKYFAGIDLGRVGSLFAKKAEPAVVVPVVVGIITMKGEGLESIKAQIVEAGFQVEDMIENEDGSVVFKQGDGEFDGEGVVVRLNDHIGIVAKGFSPYPMEVSADGGSGTMSFADQCAAQGFYPGVTAIMDVLSSSVRDTVRGSDSPAEARDAIQKLFNEAQAYTVSFVAGLPASTFKLEDITPQLAAKVEGGEGGEAAVVEPTTEEAAAVTEPAAETIVKDESADAAAAELAAAELVLKDAQEAVQKAKMTPEQKTFLATLSGDAKWKFLFGTPEERTAIMAAAKKDEAVAEVVEPVVEAAAAVVEEAVVTAEQVSAEKAEAGLTEEQVSAIVATQMQGAVDGLAQKMEAMMASITAAMSKSVGEVEAQIAEVAAVAKSAKEAVGGVLVVGSEGGDHVPAAKHETRPRHREIDTAFDRNARTRTRISQ